MNDTLLKKLEKMHERYNELERLLSDPEVIADSNRYTTYIKEHGSLSKMVSKYTQMTETLAKKRETEGLLTQEGTDKELAEMARDELGELEKQEDAIMEEIKGLFITDNKTYGKNVIAEIRAGTGGERQLSSRQTFFACTPNMLKIKDGRWSFSTAAKQI